jgi:hypothetical protein
MVMKEKRTFIKMKIVMEVKRKVTKKKRTF